MAVIDIPTDLYRPLVDDDPTVRAADQLGAAADARSAELHAARRVPDDIYREVLDARLLRQLVPAEFGGLERTALAWFRTGVVLARHEASLAWVVTQGAVELGWIAAGGDESWARELLDDPDAGSASSSAGVGSLSVEGERSRLAGRWRFNTGCQGATWIGGLAVVEGVTDEGGAPVIRWGWVPADRATIVEDWDPAGLHGTGSHTTVIAEQEIETRWTFDPFSPTTNDRGPYRALVGSGNWPIAASVAAVQLGNARRALDDVRALVMRKKPSPDFRLLADNAVVQRSLADAEGMWQAALASVECELEAAWDEAIAEGELSVERRVRLHRANATASRLALRVVDMACEVAGTDAVVDRHHVLTRCLRDAHALAAHIAIGGSSLEHNTKADLGLELVHRVV